MKLDINEQLAREVDYFKAEQVLKNQITRSENCLRFIAEQCRLLTAKATALGKRLAEIVTIVRPEPYCAGIKTGC
jgi:hypothetical protein